MLISQMLNFHTYDFNKKCIHNHIAKEYETTQYI